MESEAHTHTHIHTGISKRVPPSPASGSVAAAAKGSSAAAAPSVWGMNGMEEVQDANVGGWLCGVPFNSMLKRLDHECVWVWVWVCVGGWRYVCSRAMT